MWAATYEEGGDCTYPCSLSRSHVQHPNKLWTDTVNRLWSLRQQHWQQTSKLIASHQHVQHQHPQAQHLDRCPLQHRQRSSGRHGECRRQHQHQGENRPTLPHGSIGRPPFPTNAHHRTSNDEPQGFNNAYLQQHGSCKPSKQSVLPALVTSALRPVAKSTDRKEKVDGQRTELATGPGRALDSTIKRTPQTPSAWFGEVHAVPSGLVSETNSKVLKHMVNKSVDSYIKELKQPSSNVQKCFDHFKPPPRIHAGSLYHFKTPNLDARREVLNAIQDYHINAEARAQLEKRASEYEQEKKERQRRMAESKKQADIDRKSGLLNVGQQLSSSKTSN